jgi:hypothetical protein
LHADAGEKSDNLRNRPNMISDTSFHGRGYPQGLMDAAKIVMHGIEGDCMAQVIDFLAKTVCQASESAHRHPHGEILAFDLTGRNVLTFGVPRNRGGHRPEANGWAVTTFRFRGGTIYLSQRGVINIRSESTLDSIKVDPVSIAKSKLSLFVCRNILRFRLAKRPNLITLNTLASQVAKRLILIIGARDSYVFNEL